MRNTIDKETYTPLFLILSILGGLLLLATVFVYFSGDASMQGFSRLATTVLFIYLAVVCWLRLEYLKTYRVALYKARRVPMWASVFVFLAVAITRLF